MTLVLAADIGVKSQVGGQGTAEAADCCYSLIFFFLGGVDEHKGNVVLNCQ